MVIISTRPVAAIIQAVSAGLILPVCAKAGVTVKVRATVNAAAARRWCAVFISCFPQQEFSKINVN